MQIDFDFLDFPSLNGNNSNEKNKILKLCSVKRLGAKKILFLLPLLSHNSLITLFREASNRLVELRTLLRTVASVVDNQEMVENWQKIGRLCRDMSVIVCHLNALWPRLNWNVKSNLCSIWIQHFAYVFRCPHLHFSHKFELVRMHKDILTAWKYKQHSHTRRATNNVRWSLRVIFKPLPVVLADPKPGLAPNSQPSTDRRALVSSQKLL